MIKVSAFRSLNRTRREMDSITAWFVVGLFSATFVCSAVTQLINTYTNSSADPLWFQLVGVLDFFASARLMHTAADIYVMEVLFGGLMQIVVYLTGDNLYIYIPVSVLSGGFIFEMYRSYTAPIFLITCSKIKGVDDC